MYLKLFFFFDVPYLRVGNRTFSNLLLYGKVKFGSLQVNGSKPTHLPLNSFYHKVFIQQK